MYITVPSGRSVSFIEEKTSRIVKHGTHTCDITADTRVHIVDDNLPQTEGTVGPSRAV